MPPAQHSYRFMDEPGRQAEGRLIKSNGGRHIGNVGNGISKLYLSAGMGRFLFLYKKLMRILMRDRVIHFLFHPFRERAIPFKHGEDFLSRRKNEHVML